MAETQSDAPAETPATGVASEPQPPVATSEDLRPEEQDAPATDETAASAPGETTAAPPTASVTAIEPEADIAAVAPSASEAETPAVGTPAPLAPTATPIELPEEIGPPRLRDSAIAGGGRGVPKSGRSDILGQIERCCIGADGAGVPAAGVSASEARGDSCKSASGSDAGRRRSAERRLCHRSRGDCLVGRRSVLSRDAELGGRGRRLRPAGHFRRRGLPPAQPLSFGHSWSGRCRRRGRHVRRSLLGRARRERGFGFCDRRALRRDLRSHRTRIHTGRTAPPAPQ